MNKIDKIKESIKKKIKEMSATGTGASFTPGTGANYATPTAFNPNKKAKGAEHIYYYKLGFKPVKTTKPKSFDKKQLWEEEQSSFDIESYISTLPTDNEEVKKYIAGRLSDYNNLSNKLKELIQLIGDAKKETINTYRENPQFKAIYGTDLAASLLDDVIELFKQ